MQADTARNTHTQGPWYVRHESRTYFTIHDGIVPGTGISPRTIINGRAENIADARLAASAPALLAALEALIADHELTCGSHADQADTLYRCAEWEIIEQARGSVARARGGAA